MIKQKYQYFAVIFSCLICINVCSSAVIARGPMDSRDVDIHQDDALIRDLVSIALLLKSVPVIGPRLMTVPEKIIHSVANFEYTTNHLIDKLLRSTLPCTITINGITCEGIQRNGGLIYVIRNSIDTMPNTRIFYVVKQFLDVMTFALQVLYLWGSSI